MAWFDVISHTRLFLNFFTDQPRKPWHTLAEPLGSAEPQLKNTDVHNKKFSDNTVSLVLPFCAFVVTNAFICSPSSFFRPR